MVLSNDDYKSFDELCELTDAELVGLWRDFHECVHNHNYMNGDTYDKQKIELNRAIVLRWTDQTHLAVQKSKPQAQMLEGFQYALNHARKAKTEIAKGQSRVAHGKPVKNAIDKAITHFTHAISELEYIKKYEDRRTLK